MRTSDELGDVMTAVAHTLNRLFNGKAKGKARWKGGKWKGRTTGFTLLVFPFGETDSNKCSLISNGVARADLAVLFRRMAARLEGQEEILSKGLQ